MSNCVCQHLFEGVGYPCVSVIVPTICEPLLSCQSGPTLSSSAVLCSSTYITTTHLLRVDDRRAESTQLAEQLRAFWELDPDILKEYDCMIQEQLAKVVIEPVFPNEKTPVKCTISLTTVWSAVTRKPPICVWSMTHLLRHGTSAYTRDPNFTSLF